MVIVLFFISRFDVENFIDKCRALGYFVSDEFRGWNWSNEYLAPPVDDIYFGVSELANRYCPTFRDIYLRRVEGVSAPYSYKTVRGWVYHSISSKSLTLVKKLIYEGVWSGYTLLKRLLGMESPFLRRLFKTLNIKKYVSPTEYRVLYDSGKALYRYLCIQAASYLDYVVASRKYIEADDLVNEVVPSVVERRLDGFHLGLSRELRVDMLLDRGLVLDIKTGEERDFHKYVLTGYALAYESMYVRPIDYGIVTYIQVEGGKVRINNVFQFIGDELRREFIDIRDRAFDVVRLGVDPGKPPNCPEYCIYYRVCNG